MTFWIWADASAWSPVRTRCRRTNCQTFGKCQQFGGVAVNDYFIERAEAVADEINSAGGKAIAVQADVSDRASVEAMVAKTEEHWARSAYWSIMPAMPVPSPFPNKESRFGKPIRKFGTAQSVLIFTASLIVSALCCPA